jgi:hypothetical protein
MANKKGTNLKSNSKAKGNKTSIQTPKKPVKVSDSSLTYTDPIIHPDLPLYHPKCTNNVTKALPYSTTFFPQIDMHYCIISDRLKFIYIKTAKSAGSTILLGWLRPSLCPASYGDEFKGFGNTNFSANCSTDILYPPPGSDGTLCSNIPMWKFRDYFVFTTVRSPWERMVSSYDYCHVAALRGLSWTEWCQEPEKAITCQRKSNYTSPQFDMHYQYPLHFAYHDSNGWFLDYIIRVDHTMGAGIEEVTRIINSRRPPNETLSLKPPLNRYVNKKDVKTTNFGSLCEHFSGVNEVCRDFLVKTLDPQVLCYNNPCSNIEQQMKFDSKFSKSYNSSHINRPLNEFFSQNIKAIIIFICTIFCLIIKYFFCSIQPSSSSSLSKNPQHKQNIRLETLESLKKEEEGLLD